MPIKIGHKHIIYKVHIYNNGKKKGDEIKAAKDLSKLNAQISMSMKGKKTISISQK